MRLSAVGYGILFSLGISAWVSAQENSALSLSHVPGEYRTDISLSVTYTHPETTLLYRFAESEDPEFTTYRIPVVLSALEGEERTYEILYRIENRGDTVEEGKVLYRIDKRAPLSPIPSLESGEYRGPQNLRFLTDSNTGVFFALSRGEKPEFSRWNGEPLLLTPAPIPGLLTLLYYARDSAGNTSCVNSQVYHLYPENPAGDSYWIVRSPVEGTFLNPQVLYIEHRGYEWIRYRLNDASPWQTYEKPVLLQDPGVYRIEITAKKKYGEIIERKVISFQQEKGTSSLPENGFFRLEEEATVPLKKGMYRYNLEDRPVEPYDPISPERFLLYPTTGHNRVLIVRLKDISESEKGEYRYVIDLRGQSPGDVEILFDEKTIYRTPPLIRLKARPGTEIWYSLDGSLPTESSSMYTDPFQVLLPEQSEGFITIRARTREGQQWGPVSEKYLEYDTLSPPTPSPRVEREISSGNSLLVLPALVDGTGVYEIAWGGKDPDSFSETSPVLQERTLIRSPYGYTGIARLRIGYRDRAGNITPYPEILSVRFDRTPPPAPEITVKEGTVHLSGKGTLLFRIRETGAPTGEKMPETFSVYQEPVNLPAPDGYKADYVIEAYAVDPAGNQSVFASPYRVTIDRRSPPPLRTPMPKQEAIPVTNKEYVLSLPSSKEDLEIFYTFTENGIEPSEPTEESLPGRDRLTFPGRPGERIPYWVKVWTRYKNSKERGQISSFQFIVDRDPPELPGVEGVTPKIRNQGALIRFIPRDPSHVVQYRIVPVPQKGEVSWELYQSPILLDVEEGTVHTYALYYKVEDDAGNSAEGASPIQIVIDKQAPSPPVAQVQPPPETVLVLKSSEGTLYYEITYDGTLPRVPDESSSLYRRSIPLASKELKVVNIASRCRDEAGNWSAVTYSPDILSGSEELLYPPAVRQVSFRYATVLSWTDAGETVLERIDPDQSYKLQVSQNPLLVEHTAEREILLQFRGVAGNTSSPVKLRIPPALQPVPVRISGGEKGEYAQGVVLKNLDERIVLRYEVSTGDAPPGTVDTYSPRWEQTLSLDVLPEETVTFRIQVQNFSNNIPVSPAQEFRVRIDKTPPPPPVLIGAEGGASYSQDLDLSFRSREGTVYYSISTGEEGGKAPPIPSEKQFQVFSSPYRVTVPEGSSKAVHVYAFCKDTVGNISREIAVWSFLLDKQYLYVAAGKGVQGNGTRTSPFTQLDSALEAASRSTRVRIRISSGIYQLSKPLTINKELFIHGGFDRAGWKPGTQRTVLKLPPLQSLSQSGEDSQGYIHLDTSVLQMEQVTLEGGEGSGRPLFFVNEGKLVLKDVTASVIGKDRILVQEKGSVSFERCILNSSRLETDSLIKSRKGEFLARETRFSYDRSEQGAALLRFTGSPSVVLESSTIEPGSGDSTMGIDAEDSNLKLQFCTLHTGTGTLSSYGVRIQNGALDMNRSEIRLSPEAHIAVGVGVFEAKSEINGTSFFISGRYGTQALRARSSELTLLNSLFEGDRTEDYLYYATLEDSTLRMEGNVFRKGSSSDFTAFQVFSSRIEARKNILELGEGNRITQGFFLRGKSDLYLTENEITSKDPKGLLFVLPTDGHTLNVQGMPI
ncbi:MAG TPA: chitobiase/beta-hexosaminidase C-terminal domain-containing protein, partial [Spirochaetales bacterium]|nr:chitobiase/beta-hexosaminidase C-terminal domain-containing protein [Spirochaetales bacterium]